MQAVKAGSIIKDIQKEVYAAMISSRSKVTVFTINGYQLRGRILDHDDTVIKIEVDGKEQMVYKRAISTVALA